MQQYQGQGGGPGYGPGSSSGASADELRTFWAQQRQEVQMVGNDPAEFKNHQLPLARIKKIMKSDEDVRMISAEAPVLFAKACEMFILELTLRSWMHAEENKRRTLQRSDVAAAVNRTEILDFLVDVVPREEGAAAEGGAGEYSAGGQPLPSVGSGGGMPHSSVASASGAPMYPPMYAMHGGMGPGAMPGGVPGGMYPDPAAMAQQQQQQQLAGGAPWGAAPGMGLIPGDGEVPTPSAADAAGAEEPGGLGKAVVPQ